jgi:hypothetical protein
MPVHRELRMIWRRVGGGEGDGGLGGGGGGVSVPQAEALRLILERAERVVGWRFKPRLKGLRFAPATKPACAGFTDAERPSSTRGKR